MSEKNNADLAFSVHTPFAIDGDYLTASMHQQNGTMRCDIARFTPDTNHEEREQIVAALNAGWKVLGESEVKS